MDPLTLLIAGALGAGALFCSGSSRKDDAEDNSDDVDPSGGLGDYSGYSDMDDRDSSGSSGDGCRQSSLSEWSD